MSLIATIKSILGLGDADRTEEGTTVTVEREPNLSGETEVGDADVEPESTPSADEPEVESDSAPAVEDSDAEVASAEADDEPADTGGEPVDTLDGIGPAYAERLANAGVESVGDLASTDAAELADATDIAEARIRGWIEQAESS